MKNRSPLKILNINKNCSFIYTTHVKNFYYVCSLQKGEVVEVYYNDRYESYMITAEAETLFFVHPESLTNLDLPGMFYSMNFKFLLRPFSFLKSKPCQFHSTL